MTTSLRHILLCCVLISASLVSFTSSAVTIDFEAFSTQNFGQSQVINGVTFSNISPVTDPVVRIFDDNGVRTAYALACDIAAGFDCTNQLEVDFGQAVSNLSFDFLADESTILSGTVSAFLNNVLLSTINLVGDGDGNTHEFLSLAALGAIDMLVLDAGDDPSGIGYDNFTYDVSAIPLPATIWLFGTALIGVVGFSKRRKAT